MVMLHGNSLILLSLVSKETRGEGSVLPITEAEPFWEFCLILHELRVFCSGWWEEGLALCELWRLFRLLFSLSHTHTHTSLSWRPKWDPVHIPVVLSLWLPLLWDCALRLLAALVFPDSPAHLRKLPGRCPLLLHSLGNFENCCFNVLWFSVCLFQTGE